jgi:hypothetical protein
MPTGRIFLVALCGGGDRPLPEMDGRTAFEAAHTPHLDRLAAAGTCGLLDVIGDGVPPESDSGAMALLGYDPLRYYTGRGPLEGLGMGFLPRDGHSVAFRVNFASWRPESGQLDRRTSRDLTDDELTRLVDEVLAEVRPGDDVQVRLTGFGRHRGILALVSSTVPLSGRSASRWTVRRVRRCRAARWTTTTRRRRPPPSWSTSSWRAARRSCNAVRSTPRGARPGGYRPTSSWSATVAAPRRRCHRSAATPG